MKEIRTTPDLYAHAIAIEREAAERYAELATRMADLGNDVVAALFERLAGFESQHLEALLRRTAGLTLPDPSTYEFQWLDAAAPETAAREFIFRLMTPRHALRIALAAEERARAFFERVSARADDPALRRLAQEMALEEEHHVAMVEAVLERTPASNVDWEAIFAAQERASKGSRST